MEQEMGETFDRFFHGWPRLRGAAETLGWAPAIDVVDHKDEVLLRADLPGMTEKDVELTLQDGNLTIRGERKEEKEEKEPKRLPARRSRSKPRDCSG
jgi:HSP20 family protein